MGLNIFRAILDIFTRSLATIPEPMTLFKLMGIAFGPEGMTHWSDLSPYQQTDWLNRVPVLATNHSDWPGPFQWVPRRCTMWTVPPVWPILAGNTTDTKPIPDPGYWYVKRGYLAWTSAERIHVRIGFRLDDVDGYVSFPSFTIKKV